MALTVNHDTRSFGIIGSYFFESIATGPTYLLLEALNVELQFSNGATPYYAHPVRSYPDKAFSEWIGQREKTEWPPRSSDLISCDFSL